MYTWVFVVAVIAIVYIALVMSDARQYRLQPPSQPSPALKRFSLIAFALLALVLFANIASTLLECGLIECPDNPEHYRWLSRL
jgi:lipopolysaccharide/colanic/teichoic acid biosynthesis glycosyltransferase